MATARGSSNGELNFAYSTLSRRRDPADNDENGNDIVDTDDSLNAEFRARLGLLPPDEEGLTEAFKARIGLLGFEAESFAPQPEVSYVFDEEREATIAQYKFSKFAKERFTDGNTGFFQKDVIKEPLLEKLSELDRLASIAIWYGIQRYMGDIPAPKGPVPTKDKTAVMTKIYRVIEKTQRKANRKSSTSSISETERMDQRRISEGQDIGKEFERFTLQKKKSWKNLFSMGSSKSNRRESLKEQKEPASDLDYVVVGPQIIEKISLTRLEMVHFIIGHGILRKALRDEIICQILKQLTDNPSQESQYRGWRLLAMCAGCFFPSDVMVNTLRCFLKDAPVDFKDYASYTKRVLKRTVINGMRYHPPNFLEYQAVKMKKYVMLPIGFADGNQETLEADSCTTASEICFKLANKIGLKDQFGFSIYICIYDKVSSLGSGLDHIMDAISECEQVVRAKGRKEEDASWRLYFRKELFTPWHDPGYDEVAANLIYQQIVRGIKSDEYRLASEDDIANVIAQRYFIDHGSEIIPGKLQNLITEYMPEYLIKGPKSRDGWVQNIISAFNFLGYNKKEITQQSAKDELIKGAAETWPIQFSALFEAFKISGPRLPKNDLVIAVCSQGIFFMDQPYRIVLGIDYIEVVEVCSSRPGKARGQSFSILTVKGDEYCFVSPSSDTIAGLVQFFLDGLRRRSQYAVGLQEFILQGTDNQPFKFKQGDVLLLTDDEVDAPVKEEWVVGINSKTKAKGQFPLDCVYVLPTISTPNDGFLESFAKMSVEDTMTLPRKRGAVIINKGGTIGRHTLHGKDSSA